VDILRVRDASVLLPSEQSSECDELSELPEAGQVMTESVVQGGDWTGGRLAGCTFTNSWLIDSDLSSSQWKGVTLDRCVVRGCRLTGAQLTDVTMKNVALQGCGLDYATLQGVRIKGAVIIDGCSLQNIAMQMCDLRQFTVNDSRFTGAIFENCDLRGADLRGNDFSGITGVASLRGATITPDQIVTLAYALVDELQLTVEI
jgi:uncharacterized protein YjbI with pentapeptide repeats